MQFDAETIRWILSGFFILCGAIISWLISRQINLLDADMKATKARTDDAHDSLNEMKLSIAERYVSKIDLEKQLDAHLSPIRDDMRDIKGDIKALLQRP